jgi:hypothetical protein
MSPERQPCRFFQISCSRNKASRHKLTLAAAAATKRCGQVGDATVARPDEHSLSLAPLQARVARIEICTMESERQFGSTLPQVTTLKRDQSPPSSQVMGPTPSLPMTPLQSQLGPAESSSRSRLARQPAACGCCAISQGSCLTHPVCNQIGRNRWPSGGLRGGCKRVPGCGGAMTVARRIGICVVGCSGRAVRVPKRVTGGLLNDLK